MAERICRYCGDLFMPKNANQISCTKRCRERQRDRTKVRSTRSRGTAVCPRCGDTFSKMGPYQKYCSVSCSQRRPPRPQPAPEPQVVPYASCRHCRKVFVAARGRVACPTGMCRRYLKGESGGVVERACRKCGTILVVLRRHGVYTCVKCRADTQRQSRRKAKRKYGPSNRSRARHYGVAYEPINRSKVYERDQWRCQLCGKKVDRAKDAPHPRSPSLDHIIPMSKGGPHQWHNVQLACFKCNWMKGDGCAVTGEQLRLIG